MFLSGDESIESQANSLAINAPYIAAVTGSSSVLFLIICERLQLVETSCFATAVCCLISAYFSFNMDYSSKYEIHFDIYTPHPVNHSRQPTGAKRSHSIKEHLR